MARPPRWGSSGSGAGAAAWSCHVLGRRKYTHEQAYKEGEKTRHGRTDMQTPWQTYNNYKISLQLAASFNVSFSRLGLIIFSFLICIFNLIRMRLYAAQQSLCPCGCSSCKLNTRTHRHNITKNVDVWWLAKKKKEEYEKNLRVSADLHMFNPGFVTRQREVLSHVCTIVFVPLVTRFRPRQTGCLSVCYAWIITIIKVPTETEKKKNLSQFSFLLVRA